MTFMPPSRHCEPLAAWQSRAASAVLAALDCRVAAYLAMTETVRAKGGWYQSCFVANPMSFTPAPHAASIAAITY